MEFEEPAITLECDKAANAVEASKITAKTAANLLPSNLYTRGKGNSHDQI